MKKFFSLLLTLALVLSLAACGGGNGGSDAGTTTPPPADSGDTQTPPPAEDVTITVAALASGYEEAYPGMWQEVCDAFTAENTIKPRKCLRRKASSDRSDEFTTNLLLLEKLAALRNSQLNKFNIPPAGL